MACTTPIAAALARFCTSTRATGPRVRRRAGARVLERIRQVDAATQAKAAEHGWLTALSLTSSHSADVLERLRVTAHVSELPAADGGRRWLLHHADAPGACLAELQLLPAVPAELGGRFDAGLHGGAGLGPTLGGVAVHRGLPLHAAAPLVAHALEELRIDGGGGGNGAETEAEALPAEAVAALPGLCTWVAAKPAAQLAAEFGEAPAAAAAAIAKGRLPPGQRARAFMVGRCAWEALATRFAVSEQAEEARLYAGMGGRPAGVAWMADQSAAGLARSGGAMALFTFASWAQGDG